MEDQPDPILNQIVSNLQLAELPRVARLNRKIYNICRKRVIDDFVKKFSSREQALVAAARMGNLTLVKFLIESGVDPAWRDFQALDMAIYTKQVPVIEYILSLTGDRLTIFGQFFHKHIRTPIEANNIIKQLSITDSELLEVVTKHVSDGARLADYLHAVPTLIQQIPDQILFSELDNPARAIGLISTPEIVRRIPVEKLLDLFYKLETKPFTASYLLLDQRLVDQLSREEFLAFITRLKAEGLWATVDKILTHVRHPLSRQEVSQLVSF